MHSKDDHMDQSNSSVPAPEDLGYGDDVPVDLGYDDLGYGGDAPALVPVRAAPIRPNKLVNSNRNKFSIYGDANRGYGSNDDRSIDYSECISDYSADSDVEDDEDYFPGDQIRDSIDHYGSFSSDVEMEERHICVEFGEESNPTMPTRVDLQYGTGSSTTPRRVSLQFNQSTRSMNSVGSATSRSGRLEVSLGTSTLQRSSWKSGVKLACLEDSSSSHTERPVRRVTMDTSATLSQRPGRRMSIDTRCADTSLTPREQQAVRRASINVNSSGSFSQRPGRRMSLDPRCVDSGLTPREQQAIRRASMGINSGGSFPQSPSRGSFSQRPGRRMSMDPRSADSGLTPREQQAIRRASMGINSGGSFSQSPSRGSFSRRPSHRTSLSTGMTPREQQAMRRASMSTSDHCPVHAGRTITQNVTSRPSRRTTMDHSAPFFPPQSAPCAASIHHRPTRRATMDHLGVSSPESPRKTIGPSAEAMAWALGAQTGCQLQMEDAKFGRTHRRGSIGACGRQAPARRVLPSRDVSGRAA